MNDPLFGFLQDSDGTSRTQALKTRFRAVRLGGLAWAAAFLFIWFPPESMSFFSGLHFVLSICLYDGFLTLVEVSHSAILSEITIDDAERAEFNSYAAALAGLGSFSSFVGQLTWNRETLVAFRTCMAVIAVVSAGVFLWSAQVLESQLGGHNNSNKETQQMDSSQITPITKTTSSTSKPENQVGAITRTVRFIRQLKNHRNFWVFVLVSSIQSFDCAFEKSSFALLLDKLTESTLSSATRGLIVSSSFFFPWLIALFLTKPIKSLGVYNILLYIFLARAALCVAGFVLAASATSAAPFILMNRVTSELICRISPLVLSDLVDEDRFINKRRNQETRSASVVGSQHFFTKIASSLGPMATFVVVQSTLPTFLLRMTFVAVPGICVALQIILWFTQFGLKGSYLKKVQAYSEGFEAISDIEPGATNSQGVTV